MTVLYVVATPIGNLEDISERARRILSEVDHIAAEDTRHTGKLLAHLGISKPVSSYHDHNEAQASQKLIDLINAGTSVALVSDAGTPLISDPGYRLIKLARERGLQVIPVPGPSALVTALSVAGLPSDQFTFHGFLPAKTRARCDLFQKLLNATGTQIFYESPHRVVASIHDLASVFGENRLLVVAREMTKTFEQITYGSIFETLRMIESGELKIKGEFVLLLEGQMAFDSRLDEDLILTELLAELPVSKVAEITARLTGKPRKLLYKRALVLKGVNNGDAGATS